MNITRATIFGSTLTILILGTTALSASAATVAPVIASAPAAIAVNAGLLTIAAPGPAAFSVANPGAASTATVAGMSVVDARSGNVGWVASVQLSSFTSVTTDSSIPSSTATYVPSTATVVGTAHVVPTSAVDLSTYKVVQTATGVVGFNSATWSAEVSVVTPMSTLSGAYTATLVHSVQ